MLRYAAAERNQEVILQVLTNVLRSEGKVDHNLNALEIGSGSGQHITHLAKHLPLIRWQPSDVDTRLFESIGAHITRSGVTNVLPPLQLDVSAPFIQWPIPESPKLDLILCINVIHISPWNCTVGLFEGSASLLAAKSGLLVTYGPYATDGVLSPESNVTFDASLRRQNPEWGVRDIRDLKVLAASNGLSFVSSHEMPANNKILVFRKL
ncbi:unnamed protein product [Medioppia subpectinata]|uniref:SAM-dependent methyltransferase n=1 Tax=Medioppia subpectinata TaxID=1979941 RepID=A0A7R9KWY7_9ACAR|nr:unnamed protein product [Medioppia subpectinata]CAG2111380.1 unnamed protein product [Medioppia subpectinata]